MTDIIDDPGEVGRVVGPDLVKAAPDG